MDVLSDLQESAKPLIRYLCEKHHPHTYAIVTCNSVEIVEGLEKLVDINEFIKD